MSQFIPLQEAVAMTELYRNQKDVILSPSHKGQNILALCETFDRETIDAILAQPGCASLHIYYGMDKELKVHAILVGADSEGQDILGIKKEGKEGDDGGLIAERAIRCPEECPPPSPLNG